MVAGWASTWGTHKQRTGGQGPSQGQGEIDGARERSGGDLGSPRGDGDGTA